MPGVVAIATIPTGVAVSAETFDQALKARDALAGDLEPGAARRHVGRRRVRPPAAAALPFVVPPLDPTVHGEFDFAFVNHAPLEVIVAIADVRPGRAELWFPSKAPIVAQAEIAAGLGLPVTRVTCTSSGPAARSGGGCSSSPPWRRRRSRRAIGRPVKLLYTRADDMHHGRMRPASHHKVRATHLLGSVLTYEHRCAALPVDLGHGFGDALTAAGAQILPRRVLPVRVDVHPEHAVRLRRRDLPAGRGGPPDARPARGGRSTRARPRWPTRSWSTRSRPPPARSRALRLQKLSGHASGPCSTRWPPPGSGAARCPPGHAQGVAIHEEYKGCVAYLVEIDATDPAEPRVTKVVAAVDVGRRHQPARPRGAGARPHHGRDLGDALRRQPPRERGDPRVQLQRLPVGPDAAQPAGGGGARDASDHWYTGRGR